MSTEPYIQLKHILQGLGPLRPQAWQDILSLMSTISLRAGESLVRSEGSLAFVQQGIFKEYDPLLRSRPAIINFPAPGSFLATRRHNLHHYLKAITPAHVLQWDAAQLPALQRAYPELTSVYHQLCEGYERAVWTRMLILEKPPIERIGAFCGHYGPLVPYLKKKDIANYLHLNYSHLVKNWNRHS